MKDRSVTSEYGSEYQAPAIQVTIRSTSRATSVYGPWPESKALSTAPTT